jgi:hypothetical protein
MNILERLGLYVGTFNLSEKHGENGRIVYGKNGEKVAMEAFKRQAIGNKGVWFTPDVDENNMDSININHINGDLCFVNSNTMLIEYVDVKNSTSISIYSLSSFRKDGWYLINAYVISDGKFYGMVRNNDAFQAWVKANAKLERHLYKFNYNDLRKAALVENSGIEFYDRFYADEYRKLISEVRLELEPHGLDLSKERWIDMQTI